jgi:O-acetyl-ADP-ribose deacetylase (regulator of RNase III)
VGPRWRGGDRGEAGLLESCYLSAFALALEYRVRSIAFPCISTGVFGFPKLKAAQIAASVMGEFESRFDKIVICCFANEEKRIYERILETRVV